MPVFQLSTGFSFHLPATSILLSTIRSQVLTKKIWCASRALVNLPHIANRLTLNFLFFFCDAQPNFWTVRRSLNRNLYGRYPKDSKFQNSEYEVHQVGPKDYRSQNFSFLAFIGTELVFRQISSNNGGNGAWQTEIFFSLKSCFLAIRTNVKISNKKFSFFSTRNQNFPHIPYVASEKNLGSFKIRSRDLWALLPTEPFRSATRSRT
jgi:hypothetical protein